MKMVSELQRDLVSFFRATRYSIVDLALAAGVSRELISALRNGYKSGCGESYEKRIRAGIRRLLREWRIMEGSHGTH